MIGAERQRQKRNPPDILITTPESLYVMLTSGTRELFDHVRWTIVDGPTRPRTAYERSNRRHIRSSA